MPPPRKFWIGPYSFRSNVPGSVTPNDSLVITGKLQNLTRQVGVPNYPVIIDISTANLTLVRATELTNTTGFFRYSSPPISTSSQTLMVRIATPDSSRNAINTVNVQHPMPQQDYIPLIVLIALIFGAFLCFYYSDYTKKSQVILGFLLIAVGYGVLAVSPPTNDFAINVGFSAALLAPIATIAINQIKYKQDEQIKLENRKLDLESRLRDTAQNYRDEKLKEEVNLLVEYLDELTSHAAQLRGTSVTHAKPLSTKMKDRSTATTMANIPTLRMKQYYQYIDEYNRFLVFTQSNDAIQELQDKFTNLRSHYAALEDIMYLNIHYSINFILNRFLSFKEVAQPSRFNSTILKGIWDSEMISDDQSVADAYDQMQPQYTTDQQTNKKHKRKQADKNFYDTLRRSIEKRKINIFDDDNSYQLMDYIGREFNKNYALIETDIFELRQLVFSEKAKRENCSSQQPLP